MQCSHSDGRCEISGSSLGFRSCRQLREAVVPPKDFHCSPKLVRGKVKHFDIWVCARALKPRYSLLDERLCDLVVSVKRPGLVGI